MTREEEDRIVKDMCNAFDEHPEIDSWESMRAALRVARAAVLREAALEGYRCASSWERDGFEREGQTFRTFAQRLERLASEPQP